MAQTNRQPSPTRCVFPLTRRPIMYTPRTRDYCGSRGNNKCAGSKKIRLQIKRVFLSKKYIDISYRIPRAAKPDRQIGSAPFYATKSIELVLLQPLPLASISTMSNEIQRQSSRVGKEPALTDLDCVHGIYIISGIVTIGPAVITVNSILLWS